MPRPRPELSIAELLHPLENRAMLSEVERAQLDRFALAEAGEERTGVVAREELATLVLARILDSTGTGPYGLLVHAAGDGVLFDARSGRRLADVVQHSLTLVSPDKGLRLALSAMLKDAREAGLPCAIKVAKPDDAPAVARQPSPAPASGSAGVRERLARLRTEPLIAANRRARREELALLQELVFGDGRSWQPYPKRPASSLNDDERALVEALLQDNAPANLQYCGLVPRRYLETYLAAEPTDPLEQPIEAGGTRLPAWIAFSRVASGHLDVGVAASAFDALDGEAARACWLATATGAAYDLLAYHSVLPAEADIPRTPARVAYQSRLWDWMGRAAQHPTAGIRAAAEGALRTLEVGEYGWDALAICALSALDTTGGIPAAFARLVDALADENRPGRIAWAPAQIARWRR